MLWPVVSVGFAAALCTAMLGSTATAKGPGPGPATDNEEASAPRVLTKADRRVTRRIISHRNSTWRWQDVMQVERTPYTGTHEQSTSRSYRRWVLRVWESRAKRAWRKAPRPPHYDEWMCIHRYEGASLLAEKGTADNWSPLEQMWVAERAHASGRGFYPWPNTARYCNLF